MKLPFEKRPTCSCGVKMKLIEYKGYYDGFRYWSCDNCALGQDMQNEKYDADDSWNGYYA